MQNRPNQDAALSDFSKRPTFQLLTIIESIIPQSQTLLAIKSKKDGINEARAALTSIMNTLENLKPQMQQYEQTRDAAKVPINLYDDLKHARQKLKKVEARKNDLKPNFDAKQNKLRDLADRLSEAINQLRLDKIGNTAEEIKKENERYNDLKDKQDTLERQKNKLQKKIDSKCCHCIPSCIKDELEQMKGLEDQLDDVDKDLKQSQDKKTELSAEPELTKKTDELKKIQKQIDDNTTSYPKKVADADADFEAAEVKLATLEDKIANISLRYYQAISIPKMFDMIHIVAKFMQLRLSVNAAYEAIVKVNPRDERLRNIDELNGILDGTAEQIRTALSKLTCPDSGNRNGVRIYKAYEALSKEIQAKFTLGDYSPNDLMAQIVPARPASTPSTKNIGTFFAARSHRREDTSIPKTSDDKKPTLNPV